MTLTGRSRVLGPATRAAVRAAPLWWRGHPSAFSYGQREPRPGERVLEVGPGTGQYTLDVAELLLAGRPARHLRHPAGDARPHHAPRRRARPDEHHPGAGRRPAAALPESRLRRRLPGQVSGENPNPDAALRELEPGGRLVVGELFDDPHWLSPTWLRRRGEAAGLTFSRRSGTTGYFARLDRNEEGPQL